MSPRLVAGGLVFVLSKQLSWLLWFSIKPLFLGGLRGPGRVG